MRHPFEKRMYVLGPKIGTTIIGRILSTPPNMNTWPLAGSNLAIVVNSQVSGLSESIQFTIFDQTFPLEFSMLNVKKINANNQNILFVATISYLDGSVIWQALIESNKTIFNQLNRLDIAVSVAGKCE